jgi:hypothetical protein
LLSGVFWSLDRLSREGTVETLNHLQRLTGYGVNYRSFTEDYLDSVISPHGSKYGTIQGV